MNAHSKINPVAVFPGTANTLAIQSGIMGPPPEFYYQLQSVSEKGEVTTLNSGTTAMTEEQWQNWTTQPDDAYCLACVADNLNLELVAP